MHSSWIRFAAVFMVAFALFDVCAPESCVTDLPALSRTGTQVQANQPDRDDGETCQFEEDCIACSLILPGAHFVLQNETAVTFSESDLYVSTLDGTLPLPYHPPRA